MIELAFAGFRSYSAGPDDPLRSKWDGVRKTMDAPEASWASHTAMNLGVNRRIVYEAEPPGADTWQPPATTWHRGRGDCEDMALLKYALLARQGVPVRLVVGEIKSIVGNAPHAWCAGFVANEWHAFDNKFDQLTPVSEYINWLPMAAMHDASVVRFGTVFSMNEILNRAKV